MCPVGIWITVSRLGWLRIVAEYHGVSSHTGSTSTTKKGAVVSVDEARAWRIAFFMSPGSYSGFAMHDHVNRYMKASWSAPKAESSGYAVQYVMHGSMEQLRGLANNSAPVLNVSWMSLCSAGGVAHWWAGLYFRPWGLIVCALGW